MPSAENARGAGLQRDGEDHVQLRPPGCVQGQLPEPPPHVLPAGAADGGGTVGRVLQCGTVGRVWARIKLRTIIILFHKVLRRGTQNPSYTCIYGKA